MPLVRPATVDDAAAVILLLHKLAAFEGGAVRLDEAGFRRDACGPERRFEALVAERDGAVVGMVTLVPGYSSWSAAPTLIVHDLYVNETARSLGTGRALLAQAARLAQQRGCCRLDVNVVGWNERGRKFYEGLGFAALPDWLPYRLERAGIDRLAE